MKSHRAEFLKKILDSWFGDIPEKISKLGQNQKIWYFSQNGSNDFFGFWLEVSTKYETIFQKNLQFGDNWPQNCLKNSQIEVFGHFHHFASLVFLDFVHNDTLGWCLVVFLQFIGPVNVFLLTDDEISTQYWELTQLRRLFTSTVNVKLQLWL